jgi:pimeloyl-ACP methyl ester carboxylesterase
MTTHTKPTIVLVHGAFAESASWDDVIVPLAADGHPVIAAGLALRGLADDAEAVTDLVRSVNGPVVLVGHSYGGAVITNVSADAGDITGLVYVAGFALDAGESCAEASALAPGGTLGETLHEVPLQRNGVDVYIEQAKFHQQFAGDVPSGTAAVMAVTQRPVTAAALAEPSGGSPLWRQVPSWFVWGELDRNIPAAAHAIMAERASARRAVQVPGASHALSVSQPEATAQMVLEAAHASALVAS